MDAEIAKIEPTSSTYKGLNVKKIHDVRLNIVCD